MRRYIYGAVTVFLALCIVCCQKKKPLVANQDEGELKYLWDTEHLSREKRLHILDSVWKVTDKQPQTQLTTQVMKLVAYLYYFDEEYPKQRAIMRGMYSQAEKRGDSVSMAYALYNMGTSYDADNVTDSAYYYHLRAGKMFKNLGDTLNIGLTKHCTAKILMQHGSYAEAEVLEVEALKLFRSINDSEDIVCSYVALAGCLGGMHKYDKALEYYKTALAELNVLKNKDLAPEDYNDYLRLIYGNIGVVYDKKGDYTKALDYYNQAFNIKGLERHQQAVFLGNRGYAEMMLNRPEEEYMPDLQESLRVLDSIGADFHKLDPEKSIAKHYLRQGDTLQGVALLKAAYRDARIAESADDMQEILALLLTADRKHTVKHSKEYFRLTDSLHSAERAARDKFARISYDTDLVETKNKALNRRYNAAVAVTVVLLFMAVGIILIIRLRSRNKELVYNQQQQEANEKIYGLLLQQEMEAENARVAERNRLAMELHDGIINRIFTTRFNLMQLKTEQEEKRTQLVTELQETQDEIRKLSHDLKDAFAGDAESFADILRKEAERNSCAGTVQFDVYIDKFINWAGVSPACRVALLRIIQEACHNVLKYSGATECHVAVMSQGDKIKLRIWDNGVGFDTGKKKSGIGLKNMEDRVKDLGGSLTVTSAEGQGVVIEAVM